MINDLVYDHKEFSPTALFLALVSKRGNFESHGWTQTISVRMDGVMACTFDALSEYSGISRNKVIVAALESALEQLFSSLSDNERDRILNIRSALLSKKLQDIQSQELEISEV